MEGISEESVTFIFRGAREQLSATHLEICKLIFDVIQFK